MKFEQHKDKANGLTKINLPRQFTTFTNGDNNLDESPNSYKSVESKFDVAQIRAKNGFVIDEMNRVSEPSLHNTSDQSDAPAKPILSSLLALEQELTELATKPIVFSPPLISRDGTPIVGRGTVNIIQGTFGSHKSRLAELFGGLMLSPNLKPPQALGYERTSLERYCLCYIDSERNRREELPFAIQSMKRNAGLGIEERPDNFRFTSIKGVGRARRQQALEAFIAHVRDNSLLHLFCIIDVVTDCVGDFNRSEEALLLFDFLGNLCDNYDSTFLLVIHQNPGTEKARGHVGTEAANKSATVMQIGFEKDTKGNDTNLIRLRYIKTRRCQRPEPLYLTYNETTYSLIVADASTMEAATSQRKLKADVDDIADRLTTLLAEGPIPKHEVVEILEKEFSAKNSTIRERLKVIQDEPQEMYNSEGRLVQLSDRKEGRNHYYLLVEVE